MKKLVSFMLVFGLVAGMSTTAMAAENEGILNKGTQTGTVELTYTKDESYTVTIPANFDLKEADKDQTIEAKEVYIPSGKTLKVSIKSDNYDDGWYVKNGSEDKVLYTIKTGGDSIANNGAVLKFEANDNTHQAEETLEFALDEKNVHYAGTYTDTLTFTVTVD